MPSFTELVLLVPLVFQSAAYALAAWEGRGRAAGASKPGERLSWFAKEYCWLLIYIGITIFIAPFDFILRKRSFEPKGEGPLVVILHGYMALPAHWMYGAWRLRRAGYRNVFRHSYHSLGGGLENWAGALAEKLRPHAERGIILAGHSAGGLVALWAAARLPKGSVKNIVTLASPIGGTLMARNALSPNARVLVPGSAEIEKIKRILTAVDFPLVCAWSGFDQLVVPGESAAPAGAHCVEARGMGHTGWHFEADLAALIRRNS